MRGDHLWWHAQGEPGALGFAVEPLDVALRRIELFRAFLGGQPERHIAVVGHGTFFYHFTDVALANCGMIELEL